MGPFINAHTKITLFDRRRPLRNTSLLSYALNVALHQTSTNCGGAIHPKAFDEFTKNGRFGWKFPPKKSSLPPIARNTLSEEEAISSNIPKSNKKHGRTQETHLITMIPVKGGPSVVVVCCCLLDLPDEPPRLRDIPVANGCEEHRWGRLTITTAHTRCLCLHIQNYNKIHLFESETQIP